MRLAVSVGNTPLAVGGPLGDSVGATVAESCLETVGCPVRDSSAEALTGLLGVALLEPVARALRVGVPLQLLPLADTEDEEKGE